MTLRVVQTLGGDDSKAKLHSDNYQGFPLPSALAALDGMSQLLPLVKPWSKHTKSEKHEVFIDVSDRLMLEFAPTHSLHGELVESHSPDNRPPWRDTENGGSRKVILGELGTPPTKTTDSVTFELDDNEGKTSSFTVTESYWVEVTVG